MIITISPEVFLIVLFFLLVGLYTIASALFSLVLEFFPSSKPREIVLDVGKRFSPKGLRLMGFVDADERGEIAVYKVIMMEGADRWIDFYTDGTCSYLYDEPRFGDLSKKSNTFPKMKLVLPPKK